MASETVFKSVLNFRRFYAASIKAGENYTIWLGHVLQLVGCVNESIVRWCGYCVVCSLTHHSPGLVLRSLLFTVTVTRKTFRPVSNSTPIVG